MFRLICLCCTLYREFETFGEALKVANQRQIDGDFPSRITNPEGKVIYETKTVNG